MNDEAMICRAGMGVAVTNGNERIKTSDGVAEVIENYVLAKGG